MDKQIYLFENEEFGNIRILDIENKPYFVAVDVAKALGYINTSDAIKQHCRWVVKHEVPHPQSKNKTLEVNIIPEGDMYRLVSNSKLKSAEKFESWIFDEVLPSIRKHGMYVTEELLKDKNKLNEQLSILQNEYYELESKNISLDFENKTLKDEKEVIQKENCKLRTERHMPSVVCIKAKTDESYLPDLALQLVRLYLKEHDNIITRKTQEGIYIKKKPIEKELKKITFTSKERTLLILSIGNITENSNEIFIKNEYLADDFYLKSTAFLND